MARQRKAALVHCALCAHPPCVGMTSATRRTEHRALVHRAKWPHPRSASRSNNSSISRERHRSSPRWIPPGQMFSAIATTIFFALAATSLLSGRSALLASRLLAGMLVGFGLLVWLPAPFADPHKLIRRWHSLMRCVSQETDRWTAALLRLFLHLRRLPVRLQFVFGFAKENEAHPSEQGGISGFKRALEQRHFLYFVP